MALYMPDTSDTGGVYSYTSAELVNVPILSGTETNFFSGPAADSEGLPVLGLLIAEVPKSYVGMQLSALPDVVDYGGFLITDEVFIGSIEIFGHYTVTHNGVLFDEGMNVLASAQSQPDEVLPQLYPDKSIISNFAKIIVPGLPADVTDLSGYVTHYDKLYVVVDGGKGLFLHNAGVNDPDEGRFLLAVGQVGGQRDDAWGDWINAVGPTFPQDPYTALPDNFVQDVPTYEAASAAAPDGKGTEVKASLGGLTFGEDGTASIDDGQGGSSTWTEITNAIKDRIDAGLTATQAVREAGAKIVGELVDQVVEKIVDDHIKTPLIEAVFGSSETVEDVQAKGEIVKDFHERSFSLLQEGMDSVGSGAPVDVNEYDRKFKDNVKQFFSDVFSNLTGISQDKADALFNLGSQISAHEEHSIIGLSAAYNDHALSVVTTFEDGHADTYVGDRFANRVRLGDGNDGAMGGKGDDVLWGEEGVDLLLGGDGNDRLYGGTGGDVLGGGAGADKLYGEAGADNISGGGGADVLTGGRGKDILAGGTGADRFVFEAIADFGGKTRSTADTISDFSRAQADRIDLALIDARAGSGTANDAFAWLGKGAFTGHAGELRYSLGSSWTLIQGDVNGDGLADFALSLTGRVALTAADFVL
ncbi:MAG: hypothetical protein IH997_09270 [Proteobacteria bacterium]|nr:hypothetical protein [Pseudomonadota bacterium]